MFSVRLMPTCRGKDLPTLELELLIFQLNRYRKTEYPTLLQGIRVQYIGTDAG